MRFETATVRVATCTGLSGRPVSLLIAILPR